MRAHGRVDGAKVGDYRRLHIAECCAKQDETGNKPPEIWFRTDCFSPSAYRHHILFSLEKSHTIRGTISEK
jgi:hypothetical protein